MSPRYYWQDWDEAEDDGNVTLAPADPPPVAPPPKAKIEADAARLKVYRAQLTAKALLLPRGGARRRAVEKQVARITADLLRMAVGERGGLRRAAPDPPCHADRGRR